ncbi:MAG: DUF6285 domain-containing protein [Azonexus sp.]|jgi:hypothetical protein|nr:DUF6285 domain-containing protein [Azonexus sp.]
MRDQPTGDQLLATARDLLREDVLPTLSGSQRHNALMIANAMSIAMRQLQSGDEPERRELAALGKILPLPESHGLALQQALTEANRALCRLIREGRADSGQTRDQVRALLLETTRQRVAISNPKYLG